MKKKFSSGLIALLTVVVMTAGLAVLILQTDSPKPCEHKKRSWETLTQADTFVCGEKQGVCKKCGDVITERINALTQLPALYLEGFEEGIEKDSQEIMSVEYVDGENSFTGFSAVKYQGHTAMGFDKKNYTIKFYEDEAIENKMRIKFDDWGEYYKFCLKANYIDFSGSRNIVSANIWRDVVSSRENLNENLAVLETKGTVDGFPVALFINDSYKGLYTFNIAKDEETYGIADEENEALVIINSAFSEAADFRSQLTETDKENVFEIEYVYPENDLWPFDSMDALIGFVMNNDGADFIDGIGRYLDTDTAIDYLITCYVLGLSDNFSKNIVFLTFDRQQWIPYLYDLDTAAGLYFDGSGYMETNFSLPEIKENEIISGTGSLLWDRIIDNFTLQFCQRYMELREGILSDGEIMSSFEEFAALIPKECFSEETVLYPSIPNSDINQLQQISAFISERAGLLDEIVSEIYKEIVE